VLLPKDQLNTEYSVIKEMLGLDISYCFVENVYFAKSNRLTGDLPVGRGSCCITAKYDLLARLIRRNDLWLQIIAFLSGAKASRISSFNLN